MKSKRHEHLFAIDRAIFDSKTGEISYLDMSCECGMKLFVAKPTTHRGDLPERKLKTKDL